MNIIGFKGYEIIRNGNILVSAYDDIKKARRKFLSLGNRGFYVELWSCYENGSRYLLDYRN